MLYIMNIKSSRKSSASYSSTWQNLSLERKCVENIGMYTGSEFTILLPLQTYFPIDLSWSSLAPRIWICWSRSFWRQWNLFVNPSLGNLNQCTSTLIPLQIGPWFSVSRYSMRHSNRPSGSNLLNHKGCPSSFRRKLLIP